MENNKLKKANKHAKIMMTPSIISVVVFTIVYSYKSAFCEVGMTDKEIAQYGLFMTISLIWYFLYFGYQLFNDNL